MQLIHMKDYTMQTDWLRMIDKVISVDFTWQKLIYGYSSRLLRFIINVRANTLPTPDNLRRWNIKGGNHCGLCGKEAVTIGHILNGCQWVLRKERIGAEHRFTWRHNSVLCVLVNSICEKAKAANQAPPRTKVSGIKFVKAGKRYIKKTKRLESFGILEKAKDWRMDCDLAELHPHGPYMFPHSVIPTPLKPDMYIASVSSKTAIIIELTCPNDENISKWRKLKKANYAHLCHSQNKGWDIYLYTLEVGSKGFIIK